MRSKLVKRVLAVAVAAVAGVAGVGALTAGAPYIEPKNDGDYVIALWKADDPKSVDLFPQTLVASEVTDEVSLHQLDDRAVACGTYQVDLYDNSETTADLIDGGVLHAPKQPAEDFAAVQQKHRVFVVDDCLDPKLEAPEFTDVCGTDNDTIVLPEGDGFDYTVDDKRRFGSGIVQVSAHAADGSTVPPGVDVQWTHVFTAVPCPAQLPEPGVVDVCGADDDRVELSELEHLDVTVDDRRVDGEGIMVVAVDHAEDTAFVPGVIDEWVLEFTNEPCPEAAEEAEDSVDAGDSGDAGDAGDAGDTGDDARDDVADGHEQAGTTVEAFEVETLPDTGFDAGGLGVVALVVTVTGAVLAFARRRMGWGV